MIVLSATAIFWFLTTGMLVGLAFGLFIKKEGISVTANILWGMLAAVLTGSIGIIMELGDGLIFAFLYTIAFLFIVNVFHMHHLEDIHGEEEHPIKISKRNWSE